METVQPRDVERFTETLASYHRILVLTHSNPDPDALASAAGLRLLIRKKRKTPTVIGYSGFLTRAENREMMTLLRLHARPIEHMDLRRFRAIVLVDTQPGAGNNVLSARQKPAAVIDHHALRRAAAECPFHLVEKTCGATSTLVYEMLAAAGVEIPSNIATALFYGIRTDTLDLGREATERDRAAYKELFSHADYGKLALIMHPRLPRAYYRVVDKALESAIVYGDCIHAPVGEVTTPEYISAIADYVLPLEGTRWALATGTYEGNLYFSLRTLTARKDAAKILRRAIGTHGSAGGHHKMAGGLAVLRDLDAAEREALTSKVLAALFSALGANTAAPMLLLAANEKPSPQQ